MINKLGVGIIGLGAISKAHLKTIEANESLQVIGVTDRNLDLAEQVAAINHFKAFKSSEELISDKDIDLVVLLTPPGYHEELISACANNGKHILAEKPIGTNMNKINTYLNLCKEKGIKLSVVSQHRFNSSSIFTKGRIEAGALGRLTAANSIVNWFRADEYYESWHNNPHLSGGGALAIQAIHTIDLMLWFMGEVESVKGFVTRTRDKEINVEDTAMACIRFTNGSLGMISATTDVYPGVPPTLDIMGNEGSISITGESISFYETKNDSTQFTTNDNGDEASFLDRGKISTVSLGAQYQDVVQSIISNKDPLISGEVAKQTYEVIDAIYQSSRTGKEIVVSRRAADNQLKDSVIS